MIMTARFFGTRAVDVGASNAVGPLDHTSTFVDVLWLLRSVAPLAAMAGSSACNSMAVYVTMLWEEMDVKAVGSGSGHW